MPSSRTTGRGRHALGALVRAACGGQPSHHRRARLRLRANRPLRAPPRVRHGGRGFQRSAGLHRLPGWAADAVRLPLADTVAATFGLIGLLGAVYERDVAGSGKGQEVDVSLYEPLFRLAESQVIGYAELGLVKERLGNRIAEDLPRNAYGTSDGGWIAISASSDRTFRRLAVAIGRPELLDDPRFRDNPSRIATTSSWTGSSPTGCENERRPR